MAIDVICTGCHKRFQVSEEFAGRKGPCPECKTVIEIPKLEDIVVVHERETTKTGAPTKLNSIRRQGTTVSKLELIISLSAVALGLTIAIIGRFTISEVSEAPGILIWGIAGCMFGIGTSLLGYIVLRNSELEIVNDRRTILKASGIGILYAILWRLQIIITDSALTMEDGIILPGVIVLALALTAIASFLPMVLLEFEFAQGLVHTSLFIAGLVAYSLILGNIALIIQ